MYNNYINEIFNNIKEVIMGHKTCLVVLFTVLLMIAENAAAVPCVVTATKSHDWDNYNVSIAMTTIAQDKNGVIITTLELPKATTNTPSVNSVTKSFDCKQHQQFRFRAKYEPAIWKNKEGQAIDNEFHSIQVWDIGAQVNSMQSQTGTLVININYPQDFGVQHSLNLMAAKKSSSEYPFFAE